MVFFLLIDFVVNMAADPALTAQFSDRAQADAWPQDGYKEASRGLSQIGGPQTNRLKWLFRLDGWGCSPVIGPDGTIKSSLEGLMKAQPSAVWGTGSNVIVRNTRGRYMGQSWHIDANHLLWWDGKPYVRYGFTGNGDVDKFMELGFEQFNAYTSEELWVFSKDPAKNRQAIREVDEFTDKLVQKGATYYAGLNLLWPWRGSGKIAPEDMVACVFRKGWDITEYSGQNKVIEMSLVSDIPLKIDHDNTRLYLFDFGTGRYREISEKLGNIRTTKQTIRESSNEQYAATVHILSLEKMRMPASPKLRVTALIQVSMPMVPCIYPSSFPALWKPGIQSYYKNGLQSFRKAYRKPGLRGMIFGDEINTHRVSLAYSGLQMDFSEDKIALEAFRGWLMKRFGTIAELNKTIESKYRDFGEVTWHKCIYPFLENESEEAEEVLFQQAFELYESAEQFELIDTLQEEFRVWFYGHWLARYAKMAQEIIGHVPVFLTSAGITGNAESYLQIHKNAMLEGIEGLVRNHYAWVRKDANGRLATFVADSDVRFPLETVTSLLDSVQRQSGKAKTYFANEYGHPKSGGDDFVDDFGLGDQFSFPSKQELRDFLTVLIETGYKGFNMFKMNPNVPAAQKEVRWLSELKPQILDKTVSTTEYRQVVSITKQMAVLLARKHTVLSSFLARHPNTKAVASFNERYNVWIVEFLEDGREIAFASVSTAGRVLETETK